MFCSNCGAKLDDNAKFCLNCGVKIATETPAAAPVVTPVVPPVAPEITPTPEAVQFNDAFQINNPVAPVTAPAPQKSKMPVWVIVLIIVLSLGILGTAGYLVYDIFFADDSYSDSDEDEKDKEKNSSKTDTNGSSEGNNSSDDNSSDNTSSRNNSHVGNSPDTSSNNVSSTTINTNPNITAKPVNPDYTALFRNNGITEDVTPSAITRCDTYQVYGHELMDGVVEKMEAGYNDGTLTNMRNVVYYSYSALAEQWGGEEMVNEDNLNNLIDAWKEQFAPIHSWDFATINYIKESKLIKIVIDYTELDNPSNCQKVFGQWGTQSVDQHKGLMAQHGYIEKYTK